MARFKDHEEALKLRKQGLSYSQIKKILKINKSTLSYWLRKYPLSKERIRELKDVNEVRIERFRETMKQKREKRLKKTYNEQKQIIFPLKKQEFYLSGLFLYWGEGGKTHTADLSISNTDPAMIKFFIHWLTDCLKVPTIKLKFYLHLYQDMDAEKEKKYWSKTLNIPDQQFTKPYIKKTLLKDINHKGGFGHGTCNVKIGDARLTEQILMAIKVISDKYIKEQ
jgi:transposase-like protein